MIVPVENQATHSKTSPNSILSPTNSTQSGLQLNLGLQGKRLVTNGLIQGMVSSPVTSTVTLDAERDVT